VKTRYGGELYAYLQCFYEALFNYKHDSVGHVLGGYV